MTTPGSGPALDPVRQALLRAAHADADRCLREAGQRAATRLFEARAEAGRIVRDARAAGAAEAGALAAADLAERRQEARTLVLAARRERYDEVRRRALDLLRRSGLEPALRSRIAGALGADACVTPAPGGGLVGIAADRTVDCSLTALVEHAMSATAHHIEEAWT